MVRVAKKGSKLLVADETDDLIRGGYNKIGFSRRYFKDAQVNVKAIEKAVAAREFKVQVLRSAGQCSLGPHHLPHGAAL